MFRILKQINGVKVAGIHIKMMLDDLEEFLIAFKIH